MSYSKKITGSLLLTLTAFIWGVAFVFQSKGSDLLPPFSFTAARYLLGGLVLIPVVVVLNAREKRKGIQQDFSLKLTILGGAVTGVILGAASYFQQTGIHYTTVGKAGFITTLYIILTPIFGLFFRKKCHFTVWIGAVGAVIGLYLLCMTESMTLSTGDLLVFACAVLFTVHIMVIDYFSPKVNGVAFSCVQFLTAGVLSGIIALVFEHPSAAQFSACLMPILYTGIFSSGVGYTLQVISQRSLNPTVAALIMSLESVISAVAGYFAYRIGFITEDQTLTPLQILGCAVMFLSVIFVQLPFDKFRKKN